MHNKKLCVIWLFLNTVCLTYLKPDITAYTTLIFSIQEQGR